jgi:hypothetical protein
MPPWQSCPQLPQFALELSVLTHCPPHQVPAHAPPEPPDDAELSPELPDEAEVLLAVLAEVEVPPEPLDDAAVPRLRSRVKLHEAKAKIAAIANERTRRMRI